MEALSVIFVVQVILSILSAFFQLRNFKKVSEIQTRYSVQQLMSHGLLGPNARTALARHGLNSVV